MGDPFGQAIFDFYVKGKADNLVVNSNYTENEEIEVSYLFRDISGMPKPELTALNKCKGKVLDIGAAAGCHSLILQKKGFNVTALEKSEQAVDIMKKRGIQKTINKNIYSYTGKKYDTILLLMNGAGIGETINGLKKLLDHLKSLLTASGQILIDSSDIMYLFEEEDGSYWIDLNSRSYYGEMEYEVTYKNLSTKFGWLFVDFDMLNRISRETGYDCTLMENGNHSDYLAQLKLM